MLAGPPPAPSFTVEYCAGSHALPALPPRAGHEQQSRRRRPGREPQDRSGGDEAGTSRSRSRSPGGSRPAPRGRFERADERSDDEEGEDDRLDEPDDSLLAILNDRDTFYGMD